MFPKLTIKKLLEENSNCKISNEAIVETIKYLENKCEKIIKKAELLANNSNRITIKKKDLELAVK